MSFKDLPEEKKIDLIFGKAFQKCQEFIFEVNDYPDGELKKLLQPYIKYNKDMIDYIVEKTDLPKNGRYY